MKYDDVIKMWNSQADQYNQWADLGEDEKIEFALKIQNFEKSIVLNDIVQIWNSQADQLNQWDDLGEDEKIEFALKFASTILNTSVNRNLTDDQNTSCPINKKSPCDCGCEDPVATTPKEMLEFLAHRMEFAGVSDCVAKIYARDIRLILDQYQGNLFVD